VRRHPHRAGQRDPLGSKAPGWPTRRAQSMSIDLFLPHEQGSLLVGEKARRRGRAFASTLRSRPLR
jgi:hypothetical protein